MPQNNEEIKLEESAKVWVAVLHYLGVEHTRKCLNSIKNLEHRPFQILITDNSSPDKSGSLLHQEFPDCHYQLLSENKGFAGGSNASVNYCIEHGAEWVWILNNDTELDADSLSKLLSMAAKNPKAAILGAAVFTPTETGFHQSGIGQIDFAKAKTYERGEIDKSKETIECQWLSGSNMLIRSQAFKEIGGFDENFYLYFEDTDLCWRLREQGWTCVFVPGANLRHIGNASTQGKLAIWRAYYHTRNRLLFFLKVKHGVAAIPVLFAILTHVFRHCLVLPFRGEDGKRKLRAELLGVKDFFSGKLGRGESLDF